MTPCRLALWHVLRAVTLQSAQSRASQVPITGMRKDTIVQSFGDNQLHVVDHPRTHPQPHMYSLPNCIPPCNREDCARGTPPDRSSPGRAQAIGWPMRSRARLPYLFRRPRLGKGSQACLANPQLRTAARCDSTRRGRAAHPTRGQRARLPFRGVLVYSWPGPQEAYVYLVWRSEYLIRYETGSHSKSSGAALPA